MGVIADTLSATLRDLAQSDARLYRGLDQHLRNTRRLIDQLDDTTALPAADDTAQRIAEAIALLEAHGYTVTR